MIINKRELERNVNSWCAIGERIMLRALLFGCFTLEVYRFVHSMLIAGPR